MNLSNLNNISLDGLIKSINVLFTRSVKGHRPVAYDWAILLAGILLVLVLLFLIALYFYFFYASVAASVTGVDTQTLTINRTELSNTLESLERHESFFRNEYTSPRVVIDPSY